MFKDDVNWEVNPTNGNTPLHTAVMENDTIKLIKLLRRPHHNINCRNKKGQTPFLISVINITAHSLSSTLLKAGADPNIPDNNNHTPLHHAVTNEWTSVAFDLLQTGADVNAQNEDLCTLLYYALAVCDLDKVCMLLYYGAKANVLCTDYMIRFTKAFKHKNDEEITKVLTDYYCPAAVPNHAHVLYLYARWQHPGAVELVQAGADVNYTTKFCYDNLLALALLYEDGSLFKLVWPRFDYQIVLQRPYPFLRYCITQNRLLTKDWLECLHLILESPVGISLMIESNNYAGSQTFFEMLLLCLYKRNVGPNDRTAIIYTALSLQANVHIKDVAMAYDYFGFNEEMEALIYFLPNYTDLTSKYDAFTEVLVSYIVGIDEDRKEILYNKTMYPIRRVMIDYTLDNTVGLRFFSQQYYRQHLETTLQWWDEVYPECIEAIDAMPKVPTLLELSRNQAMVFVKQRYDVKKPYQFHDILKRLPIPQKIADIVCFKTPIY